MDSVNLTDAQFWRLKAAALQVQIWNAEVGKIVQAIQALQRQAAEESGLNPEIDYRLDEAQMIAVPLAPGAPETR